MAGLATALLTAVEAVGTGTGAALGWEHPERTEMLRAIDRAAAILTASRGRVLRAEAAAGSWSSKGDPSPARWDGRVSRTGRSGGARREREALTWGELDRLADAAEAGRVSAEHVAAAGRALGSLSGPAQAAMTTPAVQQELVQAAILQDAVTFGRTAARIAARLEPDSMELTHEAQQERRFLTLSERADGTEIHGLFDRVAGHSLRLALEALCPRPGADDARTREQRQADALVAMADRVLSDPRTTPGAAVPPQVTLILSEDTWAGLRARDLDPGRRTSGRPYAGMKDVAPATLEDGTPVPPSQVARVLCDCELTRVVLDAESAVVDLGRSTRLYTGGHRRAVLARDRGCSWPGCGTHARWCEIHHIQWWDRDGGATSVDNGVALCRFHHSVVHQRDLTITRQVRIGPPDSGLPLVSYTFTERDGRVVVPRARVLAAPGSPSEKGPPGSRPRGEGPRGEGPRGEGTPGQGPPGQGPPDPGPPDPGTPDLGPRDLGPPGSGATDARHAGPGNVSLW